MSAKTPFPTKVALAAVIGFAALAIEVVRRRKRGAIRKTAPIAEKQPHTVHFGHGHISDPSVSDEDLIEPALTRQDNYYWLRDDTRKSSKVLNHLHAENAYTNFKTLPIRQFSKNVYRELLSHYQETDQTVPAKRGKYVYYTRTVTGKSYTYHCRRQVSPDGSLSDEDIMLDENALAASLTYCDVSKVDVSPDGQFLAYSVDLSGYETYEIRFVNLDSDSRHFMKEHTIHNATSTFVWGTNSNQIFYHTMDDSHRSDKLWYRSMNLADRSSKPSDVCLYTEDDTEFLAHVSKSTSGRFIFLGSFASMTSEFHFIDLKAAPSTSASNDGTLVDGGLELKLFKKREPGVLYGVSHARDDDFLIVTNEGGATNFKIMGSTVGKTSDWNEIIAYDDSRKFDEMHCFRNFAAVSGRQGGYTQIWIIPEYDPSKLYTVPTDDIAQEISFGTNLEYDTSVLRYDYSSLTTPEQTFEINFSTKKRTLLKQLNVPGYDPKLYKTERLDAVSTDGESIPISLVYRREDTLPEMKPDKSKARPTLLYGYGSYEISIDPSFSMNRLPLLDRGVVYAIAHIRGGGEYGRGWYEAARLQTKKKTFEDFVACAQHMIDTGRTKADRLAIEGWSAGGMLMGAVMNMRPDLFRAAIVGVPFVDVLTTMSDTSLPLTTGEWQEWGNPHTQAGYDTISEYCPYSNIKQARYPSMLVLTGLHDPRVHYCEPAKYVAKLREITLPQGSSGNEFDEDGSSGDSKDSRQSERDILMKIDMSSGHFSASNRYQYMEEKAFHMAWVLNELGEGCAH